jgi:hypothetical protein
VPIIRSKLDLSLKQFLSLEHAVVYGTGRSFEIFERFLQQRRITRRVVLQTPHFMSVPMIVAQSDLIVTVPHAVGSFVTSAHMNIRLARPPLRVPPIDLKQHWHRKFHDDAKVKCGGWSRLSSPTSQTSGVTKPDTQRRESQAA